MDTELTEVLLHELRAYTSLETHWKTAIQESLILLKYWTPLVTSTNKFGPTVSGPKSVKILNLASVPAVVI
ncbi:hypothetical protein RCL_jg15783.t1 [Rhizophagus clarus]|uniref:Uncharacterized protein n=1 Tax=Rhizophagus clarus TaxID=94130 RepID=A0A8H3MG48_9GLOM|nr:hypothetical protein RCL_jg15783.t1 [Rhizophagus clarus]